MHDPASDLHALDELMAAFDSFITFTEAVERDAAPMGDAHLELHKLRQDWRRLAQRGNPIAEECLEMIDHRCATTGDAWLMELAYVLTVDGDRERSPLAILSTLDSAAIPGEHLAAVAAFASELDALREKFAELGFYVLPDVQKGEFGEFEKCLLKPPHLGHRRADADRLDQARDYGRAR
jgi:hypothetical protein